MIIRKSERELTDQEIAERERKATQILREDMSRILEEKEKSSQNS